MIRILLIRHGRTAWNVGEGQRFRGMIDLPLAPEGEIQAQTTATRLANLPLNAVYCSPLERAARTAQIIAEPHGLAARPLPGLQSMDYGDWAGQRYADVACRWPDLYHRWRQDPFSVAIPQAGMPSGSGETMQNLRERGLVAIYDALAHHADGDTIAVITHQVVTRTLCCTLAGLPNPAFWHIHQDLCNLSFFEYDLSDGGFVLAGLNDTCHLVHRLPSIRGGGTRIILIRHGQTAWNEGAGEERFRGHTDLPLDATGQAQARSVAVHLAGEGITALYASPLLRARQTIAPLAVERSDTGGRAMPVEPHEGLLDINYGRVQGLTHSEARAMHPELHTLWRTAPSQVRFPAGEGLADVQARLLALLDELPLRHGGQTVALVGHQIVNKVLVCTLLGLDLDQIWRIRQDTAAVNVFQQVDGTWHTLNLNDTCHLADPP
jgi:broad specificity phosphatase PhoE